MGIATLQTGTWLAGVAQLLDEHHLVVLSDDVEARASFAQAMSCYLGGFAETQAILLDGANVRDLESFAAALEAPLGLRRSSDFGRVLDRLRGGSARIRRRFLLWSDADEMLEANVADFSRIVNALFATAVEHEFVSPEPLVLHRVVFIGGHKLGAYAEEEYGQFHSWLSGDETDFDQVVECLSKPRVLTYRLDG